MVSSPRNSAVGPFNTVSAAVSTLEYGCPDEEKSKKGLKSRNSISFELNNQLSYTEICLLLVVFQLRTTYFECFLYWFTLETGVLPEHTIFGTFDIWDKCIKEGALQECYGMDKACETVERRWNGVRILTRGLFFINLFDFVLIVALRNRTMFEWAVSSKPLVFNRFRKFPPLRGSVFVSV